MKTIEKFLLGFEPEKKNVLPAIQAINAAFFEVDIKAAQKVADYFGVSLAKIYEVASFYDNIKIGKHAELRIQVCSGGNCSSKIAFLVIREIENIFHIKEGDVFNPRISLEVISCLGRCGEGPIMVVNDKLYTRVTPSGVHEILKEYS